MLSTICVCGAGTMGSGIALLAALHGHPTIQYDISTDMLQKSRQGMEANLNFMLNKQKITADDKEACLQRILFTTQPNDCVADIIIEAVAEKPEIKTTLFQQLAAINSSSTILASNTSSLSINDIQEHIPNPGRFAGMHFFNPAHIMKLVELVKGDQTNDDTITTLQSLCNSWEKTAVVCKDAPGFIVNRVARPYYLEAMRLVEMGLADVDTIDKVMEASGFKMGPFRLMDLIGIDINYNVSQLVYQALEQPERLKPSPLQKQKIDEGKLGRKSGEGFYRYAPDN
jgi:3-hydroxybutyryl-CoA dehydrogenase